MTGGIFSKVALVGRVAAFGVGLAVILAVVLGVASTALAAKGKPFLLGRSNVAAKVSTLVKQGVGPALSLRVGADQAPIAVNPEAGTATGLSADELDGRDSDEILPLVRAQKDPSPFLSDTVTGSSAQMNSVSITAPTDGVLMVFGSTWLYNPDAAQQSFSARIRLDGEEEAHVDASNVPPNRSAGLSPSVTLPVGEGPHTVTLDAVRSGGTGSWAYTSNNLSVMFVPAARGQVTDVQTSDASGTTVGGAATASALAVPQEEEEGK